MRKREQPHRHRVHVGVDPTTRLGMEVRALGSLRNKLRDAGSILSLAPTSLLSSFLLVSPVSEGLATGLSDAT